MWSSRPRTRGQLPWLMSGPTEADGVTKKPRPELVRYRRVSPSLAPGLDAEGAFVYRGKVLAVNGGSRRIISVFCCVFMRVRR